MAGNDFIKHQKLLIAAAAALLLTTIAFYVFLEPNHLATIILHLVSAFVLSGLLAAPISRWIINYIKAGEERQMRELKEYEEKFEVSKHKIPHLKAMCWGIVTWMLMNLITWGSAYLPPSGSDAIRNFLTLWSDLFIALCLAPFALFLIFQYCTLLVMRADDRKEEPLLSKSQIADNSNLNNQQGNLFAEKYVTITNEKTDEKRESMQISQSSLQSWMLLSDQLEDKDQTINQKDVNLKEEQYDSVLLKKKTYSNISNDDEQKELKENENSNSKKKSTETNTQNLQQSDASLK